MNANPKYTKGILQIIVAGYVIYLAYGLKDGIFEATGQKQFILITAAVLMVALSIFVIIHAIKTILKKEDDTKTEDVAETENIVETEDNADEDIVIEEDNLKDGQD